MSNKKFLSRAAALSLAAFTLVPSMAIVSEAAVSVTKVYEFTYNGIKSIPRNANSVNIVTDNVFVDGTDIKVAGDGATNPFYIKKKATGKRYNGVMVTLASFDLTNAANVSNKDTKGGDPDSWVYCSDPKTSATMAYSTIEEKYGNRGGYFKPTAPATDITYFFKSKSDRDTALKKIQSELQSDYTKMYNAALTALRTDLSNANTSKYNADELAARNIRDAALDAAKTAFDATGDQATYTAAVTAANTAYNTAVTTASNQRNARMLAITDIVAEFTEVYQPSNYLWTDTAKTDPATGTVPFLVNDDKPEVTTTTIGGVLAGTTGGAVYTQQTGSNSGAGALTVDLDNCSYHVGNSYTSDTRYAFAGEIVPTADSRTPTYEVGTSWVKLSDYVQGSDSSTGASGTGTTGTAGTTGTTGNPTAGVDTTWAGNEWYPTISSYRTPSNYAYLGNNGYWYTTAEAARVYGLGFSGTTQATNYSTDRPYFNAADGYYYSANYGKSYLVTSALTGNVFYNSATGRYYLSETAAKDASSSGTVTAYTRSTGNYFNTKTGYFYNTANEAAAASSAADVVTGTGAAIASTPSYADPYYYYYMSGAGSRPSSSSSSSSSASVPAGSAAIYGTTANKYAGWDNINSYISKSASGSTVTLDMNQQSYVPASVISTAKASNVTLKVVNENGSQMTIKPANVTSARDSLTTVQYNVKNVKSSLVAAAKKANPGTVSTAQLQIGGTGSMGYTAAVTVKLSANRAGCTVKAYRLDGSKLVREATGKVQSNGALTLNLDTAGSYLYVITE